MAHTDGNLDRLGAARLAGREGRQDAEASIGAALCACPGRRAETAAQPETQKVFCICGRAACLPD